MITLKNQLVLQFTLGQFTDFIDIKNFMGMEIIEHAGGLRPIINLSFLLTDTRLLPYINQGNLINLRYGITQLSNDSMCFEIQANQKVPQYKLGSLITITAAYYNNSFANQIKNRVITGKSYEVLKETTESVGMKFNTNIVRTNDRQTWYQEGRTDWAFCKYISQRAYKDDSTFFSYAFDCNNYYLYDMNLKIQQNADWIFTTSAADDNENSKIVNIGAYSVDEANQGQLATLAGKNVINIGYNVDTGEFSMPKHKLKTFTTLGTNNININSTDCQRYNYMITSGKDHANTLIALNQNKRNNILFSSYTVRTSVPDQYRDFRLLDTVKLLPLQRDPDAEGFYIITGIVRQYADGIFRTNLTLNRESGNGIKGNLEAGEK